jgi:hypothetical protein
VLEKVFHVEVKNNIFDYIITMVNLCDKHIGTKAIFIYYVCDTMGSFEVSHSRPSLSL